MVGWNGVDQCQGQGFPFSLEEELVLSCSWGGRGLVSGLPR